MLKKVMSTCRQTGTGHPCWVTDGSMGSKTENIPLAFTFCVRKLSIKSIQSKLLVTSVNDLCSWWYLFIFINIQYSQKMQKKTFSENNNASQHQDQFC